MDREKKSTMSTGRISNEHHYACKEIVAERDALRSQVSALQAENEELLRGVSDAMCALQDAPEINPSNYDHDQVCKLNTECTYAFRILHSLSGGDA